MKEESPLLFSLSLAFLLLFGFIIYSNTLHAPFYFDDYPIILLNSKIRYFSSWTSLFCDSPTRFLTNLTFLLNYKMGGAFSFGYHVVNLIIHLLNSILSLAIARLLLKTPAVQPKFPSHATKNLIAFAAGLIFLCHPIQTQGVTYIIQRLTSMATFFYLMTMLLYLHFRMSKIRTFYLVGLFTAILSGLSKETAFTLSTTLLLCEILFFDQDKKTILPLIKRLLPFALISLLIPGLLFLNPQHMIREGGQIGLAPMMSKHISRSAYFVTQFDAIRTYLGLLIFPIHQTFDYDFQLSNGFFSPATFGSFILLLTILIGGFLLVRKQPIASFGIFFFFWALSVDSSIVPLPDLIFEHRLYLSMLGFALFTASLLAHFIKSPKHFIAVLISLALILGTLTYRRNAQWADELLFWQDETRKAPFKGRGHFHMGEVYQKNNQYLSAADSFLKALQWTPPHRKTDILFSNVATAFACARQNAKAQYWYRRGLKTYPKSGILYTNLAVLKMNEGHFEDAISLLETAIAVEPRSQIAYYELAVIRAKEKKYTEAISLLKKTIAIDPYLSQAHGLLAKIYELQKSKEKTEEPFQP
jgi:protein O-mannosyl-transferase